MMLWGVSGKATQESVMMMSWMTKHKEESLGGGLAGLHYSRAPVSGWIEFDTVSTSLVVSQYAVRQVGFCRLFLGIITAKSKPAEDAIHFIVSRPKLTLHARRSDCLRRFCKEPLILSTCTAMILLSYDKTSSEN